MSNVYHALKWQPLLVILLLASCWIASVFGSIKLRLPAFDPASNNLIWVIGGDVVLVANAPKQRWGLDWERRTWDFAPRMIVGSEFYADREGGVLRLPIGVLITALLPLAVGAFTGFRFRLWQWLAFTALVAAVLTYYSPLPPIDLNKTIPSVLGALVHVDLAGCALAATQVSFAAVD
jgi:hypothetical protein